MRDRRITGKKDERLPATAEWTAEEKALRAEGEQKAVVFFIETGPRNPPPKKGIEEETMNGLLGQNPNRFAMKVAALGIVGGAVSDSPAATFGWTGPGPKGPSLGGLHSGT
jgi:hypothetical protein